ncbi:DUF5316 domain-containing protein [Paenibacillus melissococcoides]|uniref:DUF5316 domain-containing protein n=1 Tax=Paenibacillus melissococcoides TaxID=2912268 RepID=A0ABM9FWE6_9BACL|nr:MULTISPECIES: DUF5316 family protein [Paenibacillus]MEB9897061.1 DUF5316 family protein [Bacillus cereus]CAH8243478.1 DUF5316 domain-containing protein [Paenibacillus melissococcoides]CAH8704631.1 DUF5316 domain-containing protein [Paenibacillus melissococcoides]CAH8707897.1 DUF5316 domain-containing protein [Paenibacillus melissococcoides]GIO76470.1 hypothetical protein J6TS7_00800 [Paenibacillus dendritiformis]
MIKRLVFGILIVGLAAVYALMQKDVRQLFIVSGSIGLGLWALAGLLSGAFSDQDKQRFNHQHNTEEDEKRRLRLNTTLWLLGLPSIITSLAMYIFLYR